MRRIRSRLTILLAITVFCTSILSLVFSYLIRNGIIFQRSDMRFLLFGYTIKDVLLLLLTVGIMVFLILFTSRSTANPVMELNRATKEIASGNFDTVVQIRDRVEEFGELERNFNRMAAELKTNEYLRKDFISNVSHELKTPLSLLRGYAELLAEGGLSAEEQREYARTIAAESERLSRLTTDMLRMSRMDHHALALHRESFSLDEQLRQVILRYEPRWTEKGLEIDPELESVAVCADEELLAEVWTNLLDNAVKYTPKGGRVTVTLRRKLSCAEVCFSDNGPGMSEKVRSRVFEQFFRADPSRKSEGSGLGLPIAKRITELHGGTIRAESWEGSGSAFTVTLPL